MNKEISKLVSDLKKHKKIMAIILFGSYATKTNKPISDIDIAVIVKDPDKDIEAEISGFSSNKLDVVNFHRLPLYIQFEVFKHGKELFVRNDRFLIEIKFDVLKNYLEMSKSYERISREVLA